MAELVASFGVPHGPGYPEQARTEGPTWEIAQLYAEVAKHLEAVQPDVLVIFDSDHLNTFFLNNLPTFSVGVGEATAGPNDLTRMPRYAIPMHAAFATHLREHGIRNGFDLSLAQEFEVDHSILVPLHFMTPRMDVPIVPVYINGLAPPIPGAKRCYALGEAVRAAIAAWPAQLRVAVLASGVFSLDLGGPRSGGDIPDPEWAATVADHLTHGRVAQLLDEATTERMRRAGNIGGELLNWIAMLGVIGDRTPAFIHSQADRNHGQAFAAWRWD